MIGNVYYYRREANNDNTDGEVRPPTSPSTVWTGCSSGADARLLSHGRDPGAPMGIGPGLVALTTLAVVYLLLNAANQRCRAHLRIQEL
jgi:hypothetical protein